MNFFMNQNRYLQLFQMKMQKSGLIKVTIASNIHGCEDSFSFYLETTEKKLASMVQEDILLKNLVNEGNKQVIKLSTRSSKRNDSNLSSYIAVLIPCKEGACEIFAMTRQQAYIEVLKKIEILDFSQAFGDYVNDIYVLKITVPKEESVPIYIARKDAKALKTHYVFLEDGTVKKCSTYIQMNPRTKIEYTPLSNA